ncbi:MAG: signal recognition particle-docking protein FtsY [Myxococcales bacterium]|nr:signal recognition particle-docking protein FtsY [Myxococcales bacterium]
MSAPEEMPTETIEPSQPQATTPGIEVPGSPAPSDASQSALTAADAATIAVGLGVVALFAFALARKRRQKAREIEAAPDRPEGQVLPEKEILPNELESAERSSLTRIEEKSETPEEDLSHLSKEELEAHRKEAYRAKKQRDQDEKEARRQAAIERQREEEAAQAAAREAAEAERARLEAEEKRKVAAEAGKTLAEGLSKTRGGFVAGLNAFWRRDKVIDESVLSELEEILLTADIGVKTAMRLLEFARDNLKSKDLSDPSKLKAAIMGEMLRIVSIDAPPLDFGASDPHKKPFVLMVAGVNGAGKTTTIGKLAAKLTAEGKKVVLAAGDTFRAAAAEQLEVWGTRSGALVVRGKEGSDPGAVVFDAIKRAVQESADVVIADTAGRLHTKAPLMEELVRVRRVMDKALPGAPHQTLLVLDATNGQNAIAQANEFNAAIQIDGLVLTKLDGTAKGGVVIGICDELKRPIRYIGIGESVSDLRSFDGAAFVNALFE